MTSRERTLGKILLGTLLLAGGVWGSRLYLEKLRSLDDALAASEKKIGQFELSVKNRGKGAEHKRIWATHEAVDEQFLKELGAPIGSAGWRLDSAILKDKKGKASLFSIVLEGRGDRWGGLLSALAEWDRPIILESLEANASGKGMMMASLEVGYEGP
jgi:hypothetical protein